NPKFVDKVPRRGARIARRDDRAYREYVREEQRSEAGCRAREFVNELRIRDTSPASAGRDQECHSASRSRDGRRRRLAGESEQGVTFIKPEFLLHNRTARRLYERYASDQPIIDYHSHLPPKDIAQNRRFANLYEIWLEGDHYKWRAMRANGVAERYITGDAPPYDKFLAWARTVSYTLRNLLYHWTHLELQRYFGITDLLDQHSAFVIWERANADLAHDLTVHEILRKFRAEVVCTTDDPTDDVSHHRKIASSQLATKVFPAFRPDKALAIHSPEFGTWVE